MDWRHRSRAGAARMGLFVLFHGLGAAAAAARALRRRRGSSEVADRRSNWVTAPDDTGPYESY